MGPDVENYCDRTERLDDKQIRLYQNLIAGAVFEFAEFIKQEHPEAFSSGIQSVILANRFLQESGFLGDCVPESFQWKYVLYAKRQA